MAYPTKSSFASATIQLGRAGVKAVISGGELQSVHTASDFRFDASSSIDIDYPDSSDLRYEWSCSVLSPAFGDPCLGFPSGGSAVLDIEARGLPPQQYSVRVIVTNSAGRFSSGATTLVVLQEPAPEVRLEELQLKYDPASKTILTATIFAEADLATAAWTSDSLEAFETTSVVLTPRSKSIERGLATTFQLSIAPYSLTPGLTYAFAITAQYSSVSDVVASATARVVVNVPPSGGVITVSPTQGVALETAFLMTTSLWNSEEDNLPLRYLFGYFATQPDLLKVLRPSDRVAWVSTLMGQGPESLNHVVQAVARATDIFGSFGNTSTGVRVTTGLSLYDSFGLLSQEVQAALAKADPTAMGQAVTLSTTVLDEVDCSAAPDCTALNRLACVSTAGTCGACLTGYVGPSGDSNIACRSPVALKPIGAACSEGSQCSTGKCGPQGLCVDDDRRNAPTTAAATAPAYSSTAMVTQWQTAYYPTSHALRCASALTAGSAPAAPWLDLSIWRCCRSERRSATAVTCRSTTKT